jgi:DNA-binding MarR family transcriptional regulator
MNPMNAMNAMYAWHSHTGSVTPRKVRDTSPKRGWLAAKQQRAWVAFMRVQLRMSYEMNRQLQADSGLSLSDYDVLVALSGDHDQGLRVSDLAAQIGWERSRLSHQLRRMEERGLTDRRPSAEDGRTTIVVLTARGRQVIAQAAPGHVDLVRRLFFDPLPDNLLAPFTAALEHIHVNLEHDSSLPPAPG